MRKVKNIFLLCILTLVFISTYSAMEIKKNKAREFDTKDLIGFFDEYFITKSDYGSIAESVYTKKKINTLLKDDMAVLSIDKDGVLATDKDKMLIFSDYVFLKKVEYKLHKILGDFLVVFKDGKYGILTKQLEKVEETIYDGLEGTENSDLLIAKKNGKIGYITKCNEEVIPFMYEGGALEKDGKIIVKKDGKYGVINLLNSKLLDFEYDEIFYNKDDGFIVKKDNEYFFYNSKRNEKIKIAATWIGNLVENTLFYEVDNKFGILTTNYKKITEPIYDEVSLDHRDALIVKKDGKYRILNKKGEELKGVAYDFIIPIGKMFYECGMDNSDKSEIVDMYGNVVLKGTFNKIVELSKEYLYLEGFSKKMIVSVNTMGQFEVDKIIYSNSKFIIYTFEGKTYIKVIKSQK